MNARRVAVGIVTLTVLMSAALLRAEPVASQPEAVSLAVLDYEGGLPGNPQLGRQIAEILAVRLSMDDALSVVERAKLGEIMTEHKLTLAGVVSAESAAQVGKLAGAKLLVMGKVFPVDKKLMLVTKIVGVETGQLKGTLREVDMTKPLSDAIALLSDDVAGVIHKDAAKLLPKDVALSDPLVKLRQELARRKDKLPRLPQIAVVIPEAHRTARVLDPAVETEIKKSLVSCGITVVDTGDNALADWARQMVKADKDKPAWPPALDQADYVIVGEAFSEFALRTGDLVSCAARAEINLIDRKTGRIVLADRETQRAVDLAEAIAGKTALQKAGHKLAVRVLAKLVEILPAGDDKK
jgi:hypothetical protein